MVESSSVFTQSVTMTAKIWPPQETHLNTSSISTSSSISHGGGGAPEPASAGGEDHLLSWYNSNSSSWRLSSDQLTLLIAALTTASLISLILLSALLWRCCLLTSAHLRNGVKLREKPGGGETATGAPRRTGGLRQSSPGSPAPPALTVCPSQSAVWVDPSSGQVRISTRVEPCGRSENYWYYQQHHQQHHITLDPGRLKATASPAAAAVLRCQQRGSCCYLATATTADPLSSLPVISQFSTHSASQPVLDERNCCGPETDLYLKSRSLPASVRSGSGGGRRRSTGDELNQLYTKVNFSKKRKNRMRGEEAAIIALSKSRSQFFGETADTDTLVDNEAVIVYDERTAL